MMTKTHVMILVWTAMLVSSALAWLDGVQAGLRMFLYSSGTTTVLWLMFVVFDKWFWHWRVFKKWLVNRPYLKGTWKGQLFSSYIDPKTGLVIPPVDVFLVIRQTYTTIHLRLMTIQSASESLANHITKSEDDVYSLASIYRNTPKQQHREVSPIHHGGMILKMIGDPVVRLEGEYWTDRITKGTVNLSEKCDECHYDFQSAQDGLFITIPHGNFPNFATKSNGLDPNGTDVSS